MTAPVYTSRPRSYLLLFGVAAATSLFVAILVATESALVRLDRHWADVCYHFAIDRPAVHKFFSTVTDLGWGSLLNWIGAATVLLVLVKREWFRALIYAAGLLATHRIVPFLKDQFLRPRPEWTDIGGLSFPSGHSFGAAVVYGLLGLVVLRIWQGSRWRWWLAAAVWALIPLVALSRMMLGVHFFSDVLAGMGLGLAWTFLLAAAAEVWDRRCELATATPSTPATALPTQ